MAARNVTGTDLRGLLVQDALLGFDQFSSTLSSITQAGPLPGIPEPQQDTDLELEATGTQSAGKAMRIHTLRAGMPGPDQAGFVWYYSSQTRRGWEPPQTVAEWEPIDWTTVSGTWLGAHAVTTPNNVVVTVVEKTGSAIACWWRNASTGAWTEVSIYTHGTYTNRASPCLVVLPAGRLLCFFWVEDSTLSQNQVRCHYSDDDGATWTLMNRTCLRTPVTVGGTVTPGRLRAAYANNQILLVASMADTALALDDYFIQFASDDKGCNFTTIHTWTGADEDNSGAYQDIVVDNNTFLFGYLRRDGGATNVFAYLKRISAASEILATAEDITIEAAGQMWWGTLAAGAFSDGDLALARDDDGTIYAFGRNHNAAGGAFREVHCIRSTDGGDTWEGMGSSADDATYASIHSQGDTARYPKEFSATAQGGRVVLIHRFVASASGAGASLCAAYLGGYTQVNLPALDNYGSGNRRAAWTRAWLPFDLPNAAAMWTIATTGAPTSALSSGKLVITTGAAETRTYAATPAASSLTEGVSALIELEKASGGGTVFCTVRASNATPVSYSVRVELTTTTIVLRDMEAGADIATATGVTGTSAVQILLGVNNPNAVPGNDGKVQAWWRPAGTGSDRTWTLIGASSTLQAGAVANNEVLFGATGSATLSRWRMVLFASDAYTGKQLTTWANPTDLFARSYSSLPVYVDDGVKIAAKGGPTIMGEVWNVDTRYEYGVENLHPEVSPSPDKPWRSTGETQQDFVWVYDIAQEHAPLSPTVGLYLGNINWRTGSFWGYDEDTTAYVKLFDIDAATGQATLRWSRTGARVVVDTGASNNATDYFTYNILADSHFKLSGGGAVIRRIRGNSEGSWTNSTTKRARLELTDAVSGDPTSGTAGEIWSRDVLILINNVSKYSRYKLTIDAQDTAEGYLEIGTRVFGHLVCFARQYDFGRGQVWEPNAEITTHLSGTRTVQSHGGTRRKVTLPWAQNVNTTKLAASSPVPDYVVPYTGSTEPVGSPNDTSFLMAGVVEEQEGPKGLVVYASRIPVQANSSAVVTIVNRNRMLYGRITTPITVRTLRGNEWASSRGEVHGIEQVEIEEEK